MTTKTKSNVDENRPQPGPKKRLMNLRVPDARLPHDYLIRPLEQSNVSPIKSESLTATTSPTESESLTDSSSLIKPTSLIDSGSLIDSESLIDSIRPTESIGLTASAPQAFPAVSPPDPVRLIENREAVPPSSLLETARLAASNMPGFSLLNSLPDVAGYHFEFHQVTDYLFCQLVENEQAVYKQLYRLTWGFQRARTIIGIPKLAARANVGESTARRIVKSLEKKGLIKAIRMVFGLGQEQGYEFEVFPPPALLKYLESQEARRKRITKTVRPTNAASPSATASMKKHDSLKKHTQTQSGVSVGSRFSLEECRRYAEHLKQTGQGITNPGGYATKIFRSGEADIFIEAFLNPQSPLDLSKCPDCRGTGFIYIDPTNHDRGVRPCRHGGLKGGA